MRIPRYLLKSWNWLEISSKLTGLLKFVWMEYRPVSYTIFCISSSLKKYLKIVKVYLILIHILSDKGISLSTKFWPGEATFHFKFKNSGDFSGDICLFDKMLRQWHICNSHWWFFLKHWTISIGNNCPLFIPKQLNII